MPVAISPIPCPSPLQPRRKKWTRAECAELEKLGWNQEHLELIEGELIDTMGKGRPHSIGVALIIRWLTQTFGWDHIHQEVSIDVAPEDNPTNEPEPDAVVLRQAITTYRSNPTPEDILLAVEVSDSSLSFDASTKASLYARAGIPEYWVLDLNGRRMIVHREPSATGYRTINAYSESESVTPLAAPDSALAVVTILPAQD
jgi:Uma2 family endonuclease